MVYKLEWKEEANIEFADLDNSIKKKVINQLYKIERNPELGDPLGNRYGCNLTGFMKLYFFRKKYRIVYKYSEKNKTVTIWGIGKRDHKEIYKEINKRNL